jgi:hypothetical protein
MKGSIMNHQPYEDWLLSEEPLLPEQACELESHLRLCGSCRRLSESWTDIQNFFQVVPDVKPQAGFSARWLTRLEEREKKSKQRQSWMMLILTGGVAAFIFILIGINFAMSINQPMQLLLIGTNKIADWLSVIKAINEVSSALLELVSIMIPPVWWVIFAAMISLLSLLWIYSLNQLIQPRRMIS